MRIRRRTVDGAVKCIRDLHRVVRFDNFDSELIPANGSLESSAGSLSPTQAQVIGGTYG